MANLPRLFIGITILFFCLSYKSVHAQTLEPLPPLVPITPENAHQVELLATLGRGIMQWVQWSPDGETIAVGTPSATWFYSSRNLLAEPKQIPVYNAVAINADWSLMAVQTREKTIAFWDPHTLQPVMTLDLGDLEPSEFLFSPNGQLLVAIGHKKGKETVNVWDVDTQQPVLSDTVDRTNYNRCRFSRDNQWLACTYETYGKNGYEGFIWVFELSTQHMWEFPDVDKSGLAFDFTADSKQLFVGGSASGSLNIWDLESGELLSTHHYNTKLHDLRFSPDGTNFVFGYCSAQLIDTLSLETLTELKSCDPWRNGSGKHVYSSDGSQIAITGASRDTLIYSVDTPFEFRRSFDWAPRLLAYSPDGSILAIIGYDNTLYLIDPQTEFGVLLGQIRHERLSNPQLIDSHLLMADNVYKPQGGSLRDNIESVFWTLPDLQQHSVRLTLVSLVMSSTVYHWILLLLIPTQVTRYFLGHTAHYRDLRVLIVSFLLMEGW